MNKLASRNPVQRFKQGNKIRKMKTAAGGGITIKTSKPESGLTVGKYTRKAERLNGPLQWYDENGKPITKRTQIQYNGYNYSLNTNGTYSRGKIKPETDISTESTGDKGPTGGSKDKIIDVGFMGVKRGGPVKDFNDTIKDYKAKLIASGSFNESDFANTKSFQTALNRYFGKDGYGSVVADNKWGNQTQRAFDEALRKINSPVVNTTEGIKFQGPKPSLIPTPNLNDIPKINVPKPVANFGYRTSNTYENNDFSDRLRNMGIRSNADLIDFMHRTNGENYNWNGNNWARQFRSDVNQALGGDYSDANIRKVFNTSNNWGRGFLGRGDIGDFQNALQTYAGTWNGSYDRNLGNYVKNIDWSKFKLFKQGGQLPSRNIIERFKQKNFS